MITSHTQHLCSHHQIPTKHRQNCTGTGSFVKGSVLWVLWWLTWIVLCFERRKGLLPVAAVHLCRLLLLFGDISPWLGLKIIHQIRRRAGWILINHVKVNGFALDLITSFKRHKCHWSHIHGFVQMWTCRVKILI